MYKKFTKTKATVEINGKTIDEHQLVSKIEPNRNKNGMNLWLANSRKIILVLMLACLVLSAWSNPVDENTARQIATQTFS